MEKQTLELEIVKTWWTWRGLLQDYYDGYDTLEIDTWDMGKDPMDRRDYKESSAFPTRKPNFDAFGIPRRTRSQRGWYQVQRHPMSRPAQPACSILPTPQSSDAPATGADIPVELVRLVGKMVSERLSWDEEDDKRTMTACALVCRYWASQLLPAIFSRVTICSRRRALELCDFDRSPACWFRRFVKPWVHLKIGSLSELSWAHLLTHHKTQLSLTGPLTTRSVHQALPRSVPRSFSSGIKWLNLTNIRFRHFSHLVHLVCELPDLHSLHCRKVSWDTFPYMIDTRQRPRPTQKRGQITINMDTDMWAQAELQILARILSRDGYPFLPASAVLALASLVDCMFNVAPIPGRSDLDHPNSTGSFVRWDEHRFRLVLNFVRSHKSYNPVYIQATPLTGPSGDIVDLDVTDVTVNLGLAHGQDKWWKTFDWHEFEKQVLLINPHRIVFGFNSRGHMLMFGDEVEDISMRHASVRDTIRYAIRDESDKHMWYKASRELDSLQGPRNRLEDLYSDRKFWTHNQPAEAQ